MAATTPTDSAEPESAPAPGTDEDSNGLVEKSDGPREDLNGEGEVDDENIVLVERPQTDEAEKAEADKDKEPEPTDVNKEDASEEPEGQVKKGDSKEKQDGAKDSDDARASSQEQERLEMERLRLVEEMHIGPATEILFPADNNSMSSAGGGDVWDNLRWMSLSGSREVEFSRIVFRRVKEQMTIILWKAPIKITFPARLMVLYKHPQVLLVLRRANDLQELSGFTGVEYNLEHDNPELILQHYWIAESVVDLTTSKLKLSDITTHYVSCVIDNKKHEREVSCFGIVSPLENICLSAVQVRPNSKSSDELSFTDSGAFMETASTEAALIQAISNAHVLGGDTATRDLMWKHQVILGTLHAEVLTGNHKALEETLERAWRHLNNVEDEQEGRRRESNMAQQQQPQPPHILPPRIIDAPDDDNRPPIYYAAKQGMNEAMNLLVRYGSSLEYVTEPERDTLLHLCAQTLNAEGLAALLAVRARPGAHPNDVNAAGHTPMYTAVVHGRKMPGSACDADALRKCVETLKEHGGSLFAAAGDDNGESCLTTLTLRQQHPLILLALEYRAKDLAVLLEQLNLDFPLTENMDVTPSNGSGGDSTEKSLAALYGYPLHRLLAQLHSQIKSLVLAVDSDLKNKDGIVATLQQLLQCGFESNERMEDQGRPAAAAAVEEDEDEGQQQEKEDLLAPFVGFAPIQILAVVALELEKLGPVLAEKMYGELDGIVSQLCEELVKCGARLSLDPPPFTRKRSSSSPRRQASDLSLEGSAPADHGVDRGSLKIDANDHLLHILGGKDRLKNAQSFFAGQGSVMVDPSRAPSRTDSNSSIEDSDVAGGSSERSCAVCWKQFGTLMNRKHRCRISWRHVCDECSTKRLLVNGKEHRVSDGQFVRAQWVIKQATPAPRSSSAAQSTALSSSSSSSKLAASTSGVSADMTRARQQRLEAEEKANRDSLFGGHVMDQAANFLFGEEEEEQQRQAPAAHADGLMSQLGETRNALVQRGDKLSSLNDKSAAMVSASEDFAKMAAELNKKTSSGLFW